MYPVGTILTIDVGQPPQVRKSIWIVVRPNRIAAIVTTAGVHMRMGLRKVLPTYPTTISTQAEIDIGLNGHAMPTWVTDILNANAPVQGVTKATVNIPEDGGWVHQYPTIPAPRDPNEGRATLQTFQQTCVHSFKTYTGFSQIFSYCIFCDKKES